MGLLYLFSYSCKIFCIAINGLPVVHMNCLKGTVFTAELWPFLLYKFHLFGEGLERRALGKINSNIHF